MAARPDMMLPDCRRESGVQTVETVLTPVVLTTALAFLARKADLLRKMNLPNAHCRQIC